MKHNPVAPLTDVTINGVTYQLIFDIEAFATAEELLDRSLLVGGLTQKEIEAPRIKLTRVLFYATLQAKHPEITFEQAKALITTKNFVKVFTAIVNAWVASKKEDSEESVSADPDQGQN